MGFILHEGPRNGIMFFQICIFTSKDFKHAAHADIDNLLSNLQIANDALGEGGMLL